MQENIILSPQRFFLRIEIKKKKEKKKIKEEKIPNLNTYII